MKDGRPSGKPMYFDDEEFYTYHEMVNNDIDTEVSENSTESEKDQARQRRTERENTTRMFRPETLEEFHKNRANEIAELEQQDVD
jgi:hypothetical protein